MRKRTSKRERNKLKGNLPVIKSARLRKKSTTLKMLCQQQQQQQLKIMHSPLQISKRKSEKNVKEREVIRPETGSSPCPSGTL